MTTAPADPPKEPSRALAVLTCMDARVDGLAVLDLQLGEAHVLRNAGGLATQDTVRSLVISQRALGTRSIAVIHHTDCGMLGFDDPAFRASLAAESGATPTWDVPGFDDVADDVRATVRALRDCLWLPHRDDVRGYVFDVAVRELRQVD